MSDHDEAERGRLAQAVLDNPVYAKAYTDVEDEITRKWRDSRDPAEREDLHRALLMLGKARAVVEAAMRTGKVALSEIERKRSLSERVTQRFIGRNRG